MGHILPVRHPGAIIKTPPEQAGERYEWSRL